MQIIAQVSGVVVPGRKLGRTIGFPTINVNVSGCALPADGVYIGEVAFHGQQLPCIINQGFQPTLPSGERRVEAHILDYYFSQRSQRITEKINFLSPLCASVFSVRDRNPY